MEKNANKSEGRLATVGKKRTRTGCLNCRKKRRKCDEGKPVCDGCRARQEKCTYGLKLTFRPENAQTMNSDHPSMKNAILHGKPPIYQTATIVDVTSEVIRDFIEETAGIDDEDSSSQLIESRICWNDRRPPDEPRRQQQQPLIYQQSGGIDIISPTASKSSPFNNNTPAFDLFLSPGLSESTTEDGIFVPGSQYHELHSTLRNRLIDTARFSSPSARVSSTPELSHPNLPLTINNAEPAAAAVAATAAADSDEESLQLVNLSPDQELLLWENYMHEVSDWLDKFDNARSFGFKLPILAKTHPHLNFSILALSARQMELKTRDSSSDHSCSLALYQHAIHLLLPALQLQQRTTVVLASCLVLCVLEMLSCSPKAWKRHLDGCAALIQAMEISGMSDGIEGALFWCFARMDVCGGLISSERTLIPLEKWIGGGGELVNDVALLRGRMREGSFDVCANHVVYLCGQVIDFLCGSGKWEQRSGNVTRGRMSSEELTQKWSTLYWLLDQWYQERPEEMKPLLHIPSPFSDPSKPFPTLLYGNGPAVSGNQMYHTAALLMLKHKPSNVHFARKSHSILWHARQICGISISNSHHGCWTNSIQPLWIAGQLMSHASEHRAILKIYDRIERETGWATRWRQDDLREYWGDVDP